MKKGEIYFWMNEHNYDNECYSVVEVDENLGINTLCRVKVGEVDFTDFWQVSFNYIKTHKDEFVRIDTQEDYNCAVKIKNEELIKKVAERFV